MPRTWPTTLNLTPSREPMATPGDIQNWAKSTKAMLCSFSPNPRSGDPQINGQNLRSLIELLSQKRIVRPLYFLLSASLLISMLVRIGFLDTTQWQNFKQYFDVSIQQQFIGGRFPYHWHSRNAKISGHAWSHTDTLPTSNADSPSTPNTPSTSRAIQKAKSGAKIYRYRSNGESAEKRTATATAAAATSTAAAATATSATAAATRVPVTGRIAAGHLRPAR